MLKPGFYEFFVDNGNLKKRNWAGVHMRFGNKRKIGIRADYLGHGTTTEGVLCHEFIHALTIGPYVLIYNKDGDVYETQLPQTTGGLKLSGLKRNVTKRKVEALDAGDALDGGFICEALTELFKQEIYTQEESYHSYVPQTSLIKFLNALTGTKVNFKDFLRGDLPNYVKILGRQNFIKFNDYCEKFQTKYEQNAKIDYMHDEDYLHAQDIICKSILQNIKQNPKEYSIEQVLNIANTIITQCPTLTANAEHAQRYKTEISLVLDAVANSQPNLTLIEKQKFRLLLEKTLQRKTNLEKTIFSIPNTVFSLKKTQNGFIICVNGVEILPSNKLPQNYATGVLVQLSDFEFKAEVDKKGIYTISLIDKNKKQQAIKFMFKTKDANQIAILDNNSNVLQEICLNTNLVKEQKFISTNTNLLNNFEHNIALQQIMNSDINKKVYDVKIVKADNGNNYLITSANGAINFYKITANGYQKIEVEKQSIVAQNLKVCERVYLGENQTGAVGYMTKTQTEQDDKFYTLSDGTTFVKYFKDGKETFAQAIKPFTTQQEVILECENISIYDRSNTDISKTISSNYQEKTSNF